MGREIDRGWKSQAHTQCGTDFLLRQDMDLPDQQNAPGVSDPRGCHSV